MANPRKFAVIDFETTGFGSTDRVLEIGVVLLNHNHEVEGKWETLVQPQRDIPNSFVHRITPSDLVGAPIFAEVAGEFAEMLNGRTVVAHNAPFEVRFLQREFNFIGQQWPQFGAWIVDTQRLFRQQYPGESTTLAHALQHFGISNNRPHSALADAEATAALFAQLVSKSSNLVMSTAPLSLPEFEYPTGRAALPRSSASIQSTGHKGAWLTRLSESTPQNELKDVGNYRKTLTAALADRKLSKSEIQQLSDRAKKMV